MFAYRYCLINAARPSASGQWPQNNFNDSGQPPIEWRGGPLPREWRVWSPGQPTGQPGQRLRDQDVTPRETFSLVWCQLNQRYWVVPEDCTEMVAVHDDPEREQEVQEKWQPLHCHHLIEPEFSRPGLWQLVDWGSQRQHSSSCPLGFDEFLPRNFFTGGAPDAPCHFVGHLSLILALLAMCPRDTANIPTKIERYFYYNRRPLFLPSRSYNDFPMDRLGMFHDLASPPAS